MVFIFLMSSNDLLSLLYELYHWFNMMHHSPKEAEGFFRITALVNLSGAS